MASFVRVLLLRRHFVYVRSSKTRVATFGGAILPPGAVPLGRVHTLVLPLHVEVLPDHLPEVPGRLLR